jgi:hypothetical protein
MLNERDPVRLRMAQELMKHPEVLLPPEMIEIVARVIGECCDAVPVGDRGGIGLHLLLTYSGLQIERTAKWICQQTTKAIHRETNPKGPVWERNDWTSFVFDPEYFMNVKRYIERHNERRGVGPRSYSWVSDIIL